MPGAVEGHTLAILRELHQSFWRSADLNKNGNTFLRFAAAKSAEIGNAFASHSFIFCIFLRTEAVKVKVTIQSQFFLESTARAGKGHYIEPSFTTIEDKSKNCPANKLDFVAAK